MKIKKMIPSIYLYENKAVKSFSDYSVVDGDPVKLAKYYEDNDCDAVLIYDLSSPDSESEHETALVCIKEICENVSIPVYGAGNVKCMEDVKKLLYSGCARAALNFSKESNVAILEEVSEKFGKDKIFVSIKDSAELSLYVDMIEEYADAVLFLYHTEIRQAAEMCKLPYIAVLPEISLEKLIELFSQENIVGISGDVISENADNIKNLKKILSENGILTMKNNIVVPFSELKKGPDGLVPCIVQDVKNGEVLMMAYMNEESYNKTLQTGRMTYWSRSRQELWLKGETSGHYQYLCSMMLDCDSDTLLAKVDQVGAACHTGNRTCFFKPLFG